MRSIPRQIVETDEIKSTSTVDSPGLTTSKRDGGVVLRSVAGTGAGVMRAHKYCGEG